MLLGSGRTRRIVPRAADHGSHLARHRQLAEFDCHLRRSRDYCTSGRQAGSFPDCTRDPGRAPVSDRFHNASDTVQPEAVIPDSPEPVPATPVAPQSPDVAPEEGSAKNKPTAKNSLVAAT